MFLLLIFSIFVCALFIFIFDFAHLSLLSEATLTEWMDTFSWSPAVNSWTAYSRSQKQKSLEKRKKEKQGENISAWKIERNTNRGGNVPAEKNRNPWKIERKTNRGDKHNHSQKNRNPWKIERKSNREDKHNHSQKQKSLRN